MPDGLSEQVYVGRRTERLNDGPSMPLGTQACETFNGLPKLPKELGRLDDLPSPIRTLARALSEVPPSAVPPAAHAIADVLMEVGQVFEARDALQRHLMEGAAGARFDRWLHAEARWVGPEGDAERFRATPVGAILLSAVYGVRRGRLRTCDDCGKFVVFPSGRWQGHFCEVCRERRAGRARPGESPRLSAKKAERWAKVQDRMRKRGFARLAKQLGMNELPPRLCTAWKAWALDLLHQVTTRQGLNEWEKTVAPPGTEGWPKGKTRQQHGRE
jgi:hypothetical protein